MRSYRLRWLRVNTSDSLQFFLLLFRWVPSTRKYCIHISNWKGGAHCGWDSIEPFFDCEMPSQINEEEEEEKAIGRFNQEDHEIIVCHALQSCGKVNITSPERTLLLFRGFGFPRSYNNKRLLSFWWPSVVGSWTCQPPTLSVANTKQKRNWRMANTFFNLSPQITKKRKNFTHDRAGQFEKDWRRWSTTRKRHPGNN